MVTVTETERILDEGRRSPSWSITEALRRRRLYHGNVNTGEEHAVGDFRRTRVAEAAPADENITDNSARERVVVGATARIREFGIATWPRPGGPEGGTRRPGATA